MGTIINLNDNTPAAPAGSTNVKWAADNANPRNVSASYPTPSLAADSDVLLTAPALGDVLEWNGTKWVNSASSSGGVPSGSNVVTAAPRLVTDNAYAGYSIQKKIAAGTILNLATSWKFSFSFDASVNYVANGVVYRTLVDDATVVDATPVTWGSSTTVNFTTSGASAEIFSDAIALPLDGLHDYYVVVYFQTGSGSLHVFTRPTVLPESVSTGYTSGDRTGLTTGGTVLTSVGTSEESVYRIVST